MDERVERITKEFNVSENYARAWVSMMDTEVRKTVEAEIRVYEARFDAKLSSFDAKLSDAKQALTWRMVIALLGGLGAGGALMAIIVELASRL